MTGLQYAFVPILSVTLCLASPAVSWAEGLNSDESAATIQNQRDIPVGDADQVPEDTQADTTDSLILPPNAGGVPTTPSQDSGVSALSSSDLAGTVPTPNPSAEDIESADDKTPEAMEMEPEGLATQSNGFAYVHDPQENPYAMADIVADDAAVYGFRPSSEGSLKQYAAFDWSDSALVEAGRQDRIAYHESIASMYDILESMAAAGASTEEIARAVSTRRNEIRMESYADDPEGLAAIKARNLERYGNENGGTPDYFYALYGSWEAVIDKSFSTNSGMDACLGLYDDYYGLYVLIGQVADDGKGGTDTNDPIDPEETDMDDPVDSGGTEDDTNSDSVTPETEQQGSKAGGETPTRSTASAQIDSVTSPTKSSSTKLPATGDAAGEFPFLAGGIILVGLGTCLRSRRQSRAA